MTSITPSLRLVVITLVVGCVVASLTGATAKERVAPADGNLKIAVVNPARIILESKFYKTETDKLNKLNQDTLTRLRTWDSNKYLPQADQETLGDLTVEENSATGLDAAKKAQKQKLLDKEKALFDDSVALQTKNPLTPEEQARLREFAKLEADTGNRIQAKSAAVKERIDKEYNTVRDTAEKAAKDSMAKVAKKDGYNLIFSSEVVLFADSDITDKVLNDLNSK